MKTTTGVGKNGGEESVLVYKMYMQLAISLHPPEPKTNIFLVKGVQSKHASIYLIVFPKMLKRKQGMSMGLVRRYSLPAAGFPSRASAVISNQYNVPSVFL